MRVLIIFVVMVAVVFGLFFLNIQGPVTPDSARSLSESPGKVVVVMVGAISEKWNPEEVKNFAAPALLEQMRQNMGVFEGVLQTYSALGTLTQPPACEARPGAENTAGDIHFTCKTQYTAGVAAWHITLTKDMANGLWKIASLMISSPQIVHSPLR